MSPKYSYCVIGAGTAGIAAARRIVEAGGEVTIFEQTDRLGGTWNYTDAVGKDKYGLPIHTSMYQGLRTNLPKEVMGFPDFPIPRQKASYIPAEDILNFVELYASTFELIGLVKLEHHVIFVEPVDGGPKKWKVAVKNLPQHKVEIHFFDYVLVCNGHYHTPMVPSIPNSERFKGKQLHSHDYRSAEHFKDESVLVIGAGPSGMDIALEISKHANQVTLSHHSPEPFKTVFPANLTEKPDVKELTHSGVVFVDDTRNDYSIILYCTGYRYSFPFLSPACGITVEDNYVQPLYKHCINIAEPTMAFIGIPFYVCAAQMFDLQIRFCLQFYTGRIGLPKKEEMRADEREQMEHRWWLGYKKRQAHMMGPAQGDYYEDLAKTAGLVPIKPVMAALHTESSRRFNDDLLNFRNDVFRIVDDYSFEEV
ncbi:senecionine N-oxygenase-like [Uranotaenia lowii]|uniref:senecionine N-oxygenase-like n=1 Tax=Uranotaenia lowii TaxID=190385 RepID=UPI0024792C36|nr:senecionine N-oxygenase-like [Uranotaenia lowii]